MPASVKHEWGLFSGSLNSIVVGEFSQSQPFCPIILPVIHKEPKILLYFLVDSFSLTICLRMVGCRRTEFDAKNGAELLHESGDKLGTSVTEDLLRDAMKFPDIVSVKSGNAF